MKILKFWKTQDGRIVLGTDGARMVDMSQDPRSNLIPKALFASEEYKITEDVNFVRQGFFIKMANVKGLTTSIEALYCTHEGKHIVIVNTKTYCFFMGCAARVTRLAGTRPGHSLHHDQRHGGGGNRRRVHQAGGCRLPAQRPPGPVGLIG